MAGKRESWAARAQGECRIISETLSRISEGSSDNPAKAILGNGDEVMIVHCEKHQDGYWGCPLGETSRLRHCLPFAAFRFYCPLSLLQDAHRLDTTAGSRKSSRRPIPRSGRFRLDFQAPSVHRTESKTKWRSAKGILRLALPVVIAGAVLFTSIESPFWQRTDIRPTRRNPQSILTQWTHSIRWASTFAP